MLKLRSCSTIRSFKSIWVSSSEPTCTEAMILAFSGQSAFLTNKTGVGHLRIKCQSVGVKITDSSMSCLRVALIRISCSPAKISPIIAS
ncbi:Uncharacterised protein [Vibrio cholerae]|nr:Uncharacterised protein [Vibrio cholerae]